jgi:hypothetical protein
MRDFKLLQAKVWTLCNEGEALSKLKLELTELKKKIKDKKFELSIIADEVSKEIGKYEERKIYKEALEIFAGNAP